MQPRYLEMKLPRWVRAERHRQRRRVEPVERQCQASAEPLHFHDVDRRQVEAQCTVQDWAGMRLALNESLAPPPRWLGTDIPLISQEIQQVTINGEHPVEIDWTGHPLPASRSNGTW